MFTATQRSRLGLNRIRDLEPAEPVRRYEREYPGELIHIDIKKLGRFEQVGHRITGDRSRVVIDTMLFLMRKRDPKPGRPRLHHCSTEADLAAKVLRSVFWGHLKVMPLVKINRSSTSALDR